MIESGAVIFDQHGVVQPVSSLMSCVQGKAGLIQKSE